jgi:hypothetical protein
MNDAKFFYPFNPLHPLTKDVFTHPLNPPLYIRDCVIIRFFVAVDFSLRKSLTEFQQVTQSKDCGYKVKTRL